MKKTLFTGCGAALVTPFHDQKVDDAALDKLLNLQIENGADCVVVCGTTGEPATMTGAEWAHVIGQAVKTVNGRIPVIAGTGGNCTLSVIENAKKAKDLGADGQLCVTPYYNKTTQKGLIAHYTAIADANILPIIMYNVPSRTGVNMLPETAAVLAKNENIVGLKEASGNMQQVNEVLALTEGKLAVYSGNDEIAVPMMAMGAQGLISVASNFMPAYMRDMTHACLENHFAKGAAMQKKIMPLIRLLFCEVSPIPVKYAMEVLGLCGSEVRLPLVPMEEKNAKLLCCELQKLKETGVM